MTFQLKSGPADKVVTLTWTALLAEVTRAANLLRGLGVGPHDTVAYILPNGLEAPVALLAGATAGIVHPINPMLAPEQIGALLEETAAKAVITLAPFPKTDLAQRVAAALTHAPSVRTVLQVDLARYLSAPTRWIAPFLAPKLAVRHQARVLDFHAAVARGAGERRSTSPKRTPSESARRSTPAAPPGCRRSPSTTRAASSTTAGAA